ncbi:MAG: acyl-CoA dehydrogenase family protein [Vicinamibacterales bacterium]|nr:acyl-CoA dehydrogenase family protein [Vicinamibacterales bacterium]
MTFAYTPAQQSVQDRARAAADRHVRPAAQAIDAGGRIPDAVTTALAAEALWPAPDAVSALVVVEEIAAASPAVAASIALAGAVAGDAGLPGLRGFASAAGGSVSAEARVAVAGLALGIGRAALEEAIGVLKNAGARPKGSEQTPHWVLADAATEIDGARLLALKAAQTIGRGQAADAEAAMAQSFANLAAQKAVEAALRILGPEGYRQGTVLERLTRDQRAASLLTGTEEEPRAVAAAGTLPQ